MAQAKVESKSVSKSVSKSATNQSATTTNTDPTQALAKQVSTIVTQAKSFVIKSGPDCEIAVGVRDNIRAAKVKVEELFGKAVKAAHLAHTEAKAVFNRYNDPLVEADGILQSKVKEYVREQERIKFEETRRLQREAEEKARIEAEERKLALAQEMADRGDMDAAAEIIEAETVVEPVRKVIAVNDNLPKVDKRFIRDKWIGRVDNLKLLVAAVAAGTVPINALEPNQKFLDGMAKNFKDTEALAYPGVVVVCE